jgi:hypothetical protein
MELKNEKEIFHAKLKEILYSDDYRHLRFVFLISTIVSICIFVLYTYVQIVEFHFQFMYDLQ